jgi:hypothetical protein
MCFVATNSSTLDGVRATVFIVWRTAYRYDKFLTLLQLSQTRTRSRLLFGSHSASWTVTVNESPTQAVFEVSSLAPEHIIKPGNFNSRSGYRPIDNHWSDTSVKIKLMLWLLLIGFMLSPIFKLQVIFIRCCTGLIMCSINIDKSVIHMSITARPSHLCVLLSRKLERLLDHLDNQCTTHNFQYDG